MQAQRATAADGLSWIACGVRLFRREALTWMAMAALYFVIALALRRIPFMGNLVLILVTPTLLGGALLTARELDDAGAAAGGAQSAASHGLMARLAESPRRLFRVFTQGHTALAATITSILTLGLAMIAIIVDYLLSGGSMLTGVAAEGAAGALRPLALAAGFVALLVYGLLALSLFHLVHLTLLAGLEAMAAVAASLRGTLRNFVPLLVFASAFLAAAVAIAIVLGSASMRWLGYPLLFGVGSILLPIFVAGSYCSYRALYPGPGATAP